MSMCRAVSSVANDLLASELVWDNHACIPLRPMDEAFLPDLSRYRRVGVSVVSLNVGFGDQGPEDHIRMLAHLRRWIAQRPDEYVLVRCAADVETVARGSSLGVCFDIEGMNAIVDQISLVELYYDLGVRWMLVRLQ